jgi:urocanate hydratase
MRWRISVRANEGSYMYIGPQGIVYGTTITVLNAFVKNKTQRRFIYNLRIRRNEWCPTKSGYCRMYYRLRGGEPKNNADSSQSGWINEVVEDINELVKSFQSQQRNGIYRLSWKYS